MLERCEECGAPARHPKWRKKMSGGYWDWYCNAHKPAPVKARVNARRFVHPVDKA